MLRFTPLSLTLSGGNYPSQFYKNKFHKSHHFDVFNNIPMLAEGNKTGIGGELIQNEKTEDSLHPLSTRKIMKPSWLVYDKETLRFFGFFKGNNPDSRFPYQIRKIKLLYFMEDDTIQIIELGNESKSNNNEGCLVSRQKIRRSAPFENENLSILDVNVNKTIKVLDRIYHLTDCDSFTRTFLQRLGIVVPNPVDIPIDPAVELRRREKEALVPTHPLVKDFRFARFLQNDRKVLRFSAFWDDRNSENGDVRFLELLYHLSDGTFEIKEKLPINCGRQSNGMFLKRQKLPRHASQIRPVGEGNLTILNVLGRNTMKGRFIRDRLESTSGDDDINYYNEKDLTIGQTIKIYGRDVILTDCDGHTKQFYKQKYGIEEFEKISTPQNSKPVFCKMKISPEDKELPPYNGWGGYEDSEGNCLGLEVKAPKIDFKKFMEFDKKIMRFGAKMISDAIDNNERLFVISYYLSDDTISVYEMKRRNLGFVAGEFFGKSKFYYPGQRKFSSERPVAYQSLDFYIGATVKLRDYSFQILSADLFALKFMEEHKEIFPMSNAHLILTKVRAKLEPIYKDFIAGYMMKVKTILGSIECISNEDFRDLLIDLLRSEIVEQEIVTLCRHFAIKNKKSPAEYREQVRSIIQGEISRGLWEDITRTREYIYHLSPDNVKFLSENKVLKIVRGCRVPIDKALVKEMFQVLDRNEQNEINVDDLFYFLDVKTTTKAFLSPPVNPKKNQFDFETETGVLIDWMKFIKAIDLEDSLKTSE